MEGADGSNVIDPQSASLKMKSPRAHVVEAVSSTPTSTRRSLPSLSPHKPIPVKAQTDVMETAPSTDQGSVNHDRNSSESTSALLNDSESLPIFTTHLPTAQDEHSSDSPYATKIENHPLRPQNTTTREYVRPSIFQFNNEFYAPSSPLSSICTPPRDSFPYNSPSPDPLTSTDGLSSRAGSEMDDVKDKMAYDYDYDEADGHRILRVKPTEDQWGDFPAILGFARSLNAEGDGCFKMVLPQELREPLPEKGTQKVPANAYKPKQIKKNSFWRVNTVPSEGVFASNVPGPQNTATVTQALNDLRKLYRKSNDKMIRNVRYRVDVPAWTAEQRLEAGVPERSPMYPLKGDKLDETKAIIPGIHTPYVYESGPYFGASFQIHAEDFRLISLNHLYKGRKIWLVVPCTALDVAEEALGRKGKCSQFMRHRAEFFFPQKLDKMGIPYRIVDQRPGETIVILPDAYHEGFSTGYTIAEAKNYGDLNWTIDTYQPCEESCGLITAIPAELMRPLEAGEVRLDLCAGYEAMMEEEEEEEAEEEDDEKRKMDDNEMETGPNKRVKT